MAEDDSRWLRKATDLERLFEIGHKHGVYLTHYTLDLATAKPIDEEFMMTCLRHLYRQVPVLRVCLQERNSELWLREMKECKIDLKMINGGDLEKEREKATLHTYDSMEGPLWCVRVVPETNPPPSSSHVGRLFPHVNSLIFGIHHSISDGTTNIKICNLLCHIINDVMCGQSINDGLQLGEFTGDEEIMSIYNEEMVKLKENPQLCSEIKRELSEGAQVRPLIRHLCAVPQDVSVSTQSVNLTFEKGDSERFYRTAKSNGVSLHSALTGLINSALVKLMQEHGVDEDIYNIRAGHDMNVRKYYSRESSNVLGIHGPLFGYRTFFFAPKDILTVFWESVQQFHKKFHSDIASRRVLTTAAYRMMYENTNHNFAEMFRADAEPNYYYTISNMGNLKDALFEDGNCVSLQRLTRFSSLRNRGSFMCIYVHTFREQLNVIFAYSTRFLTRDFVQRLTDLCRSNMRLVCEV